MVLSLEHAFLRADLLRFIGVTPHVPCFLIANDARYCAIPLHANNKKIKFKNDKNHRSNAKKEMVKQILSKPPDIKTLLNESVGNGFIRRWNLVVWQDEP